MPDPTARTLEVIEWTFDLPAGWYIVPLGSGVESRRWASSVLDEVEQEATEPGRRGSIIDDLAALRDVIRARSTASTQAAVSIRPRGEITIGCTLVAGAYQLDDDDDADSFQVMLETSLRSLGAGSRDLGSEVWRETIDAGELVGAFQRYETRAPGDEIGVARQRTVFGVFPPGSTEMLEFEFGVVDWAAVRDLREDTAALVRTLQVQLGALADAPGGAR